MKDLSVVLLRKSRAKKYNIPIDLFTLEPLALTFKNLFLLPRETVIPLEPLKSVDPLKVTKPLKARKLLVTILVLIVVVL